ncbi:hypothetical protein NCDO895_1709 [Lactococcus lactis subsp. lactis]|uniref:DUF4430 domain-containing protein n=1 Tax=Lactococcus lactis TaxID=1358 RepID=UPI00071DD509|nr:DUF4430 domain-containing protein [Lactococcus lactis]KSU26819.1 hypothetical protein NCDO895_1709 [Lactococcus lactis subsp. lactis]MDU0402222.1 hypothetical protein [Lactococcus lactis]
MKKIVKNLQVIVALVFALLMLSACFTSKSELPRNTSNAHSNKETTVTVIIEGKSKRYQVKKGTTLLSFAISQLNAKEHEGFITSVGNLRQNTKESIYLMFDINGKRSVIGAGGVKIINGEKIRFYLEKY